MNLIFATLIGISFPASHAPDSVAAARRIAASVQLAAQEYRVGVADGRVTVPGEVDEARLFLTEARRTASTLSPRLATAVIADIDHLLDLVRRVAAPDSITALARHTTDDLATLLGVSLDEIPDRTPSLKRGAEVFQRECSTCHGVLGAGDGPAGRMLHPPPASLSTGADLSNVTPLSFYQRVTIGVAGTAMPAFETRLPAEDRWAVALYASTLRQKRAAGAVPAELRRFPVVAKLSDAEVLAALGPAASPELLAAVRSYQVADDDRASTAAVFASVNRKIAEASALSVSGRHEEAVGAAFDSYLEFEKVETGVRAKNPRLATDLETAFATLRTRVAGGATKAELDGVLSNLAGLLEEAVRVVSDRMSPIELFGKSLVIMLREGLEAILIIGALIAFLVKAGAGHRKRDIHIGVGAAIAMSLLTAVLMETVFVMSAAHREVLEGATLLVAVGVLFYVSYWLLSKMEVAKWTAFVKQRLAVAVSGGSAFALASAAFLAVYREGFETVLFYKALFIEGNAINDTFLPVTAGIVVGGAALSVVYIAINKWGMRLRLKPFFGFTSAFLYYMAFVFAGKGVAELQEGRVLPMTMLHGWPRLPTLGITPTRETMLAQGVIASLAVIALIWIFGVQRSRTVPVAVPVPTTTPDPVAAPNGAEPEAVMLRSLERMEADLNALKSEVERLRDTVVDATADDVARGEGRHN